MRVLVGEVIDTRIVNLHRDSRAEHDTLGEQRQFMRYQ